MVLGWLHRRARTSSNSTVSVTRLVDEKVDTVSTSIIYCVMFEPPLSVGTST